MVGRLVQDEEVALGAVAQRHQRPGQRHPLGLAARQRGRRRCRAGRRCRGGRARPRPPSPRRPRCAPCPAGSTAIWSSDDDAGAPPPADDARLGLDGAGEHAEQRGLPRAVDADDGQPVAAGDGHRQVGEQRLAGSAHRHAGRRPRGSRQRRYRPPGDPPALRRRAVEVATGVPGGPGSRHYRRPPMARGDGILSGPLDIDGPRKRQPTYPTVEGEVGLEVLHRATGVEGTIVGFEHGGVAIRDRNTRLAPAGAPRPGRVPGRGPLGDARAAPSGQRRRGRPAAPRRARSRCPASRRGWHGRAASWSRASTTPSWSRRCGATTCGSRASSSSASTAWTTSPTWSRTSAPGPGRRLGVLLDHLVDGTKEARVAAAVRHPHVLVTGTPYVDVWQAVRPDGRRHRRVARRPAGRAVEGGRARRASGCGRRPASSGGGCSGKVEHVRRPRARRSSARSSSSSTSSPPATADRAFPYVQATGHPRFVRSAHDDHRTHHRRPRRRRPRGHPWRARPAPVRLLPDPGAARGGHPADRRPPRGRAAHHAGAGRAHRHGRTVAGPRAAGAGVLRDPRRGRARHLRPRTARGRAARRRSRLAAQPRAALRGRRRVAVVGRPGRVGADRRPRLRPHPRRLGVRPHA